MWELHHVNLAVYNVREAAAFYAEVLGMEESAFPVPENDRGQFKHGRDDLILFDGGKGQLHLNVRSRTLARDNGLHMDIIQNGHVAIRVPDLDAVRARLRARDVYFQDAGAWAMKGHEQIYVYDPSFNMVEVNQEI